MQIDMTALAAAEGMSPLGGVGDGREERGESSWQKKLSIFIRFRPGSRDQVLPEAARTDDVDWEIIPITRLSPSLDYLHH